MEKSSDIIRRIYCQARNVPKISDRQWSRVANSLELANCEMNEAIARVRVYGRMRSLAPFCRISLSQVEARLRLNEVEGLSKVTGRELIKQIQKHCEVSARTARRWGDSIKVPLRMDRTYQGEELRQWAEQMILHTGEK